MLDSQSRIPSNLTLKIIKEKTFFNQFYFNKDKIVAHTRVSREMLWIRNVTLFMTTPGCHLYAGEKDGNDDNE